VFFSEAEAVSKRKKVSNKKIAYMILSGRTSEEYFAAGFPL
jgi:hypothetical protein